MKFADAEGLALEALSVWFDGEKPPSGADPLRYVVCAGLAVAERMREKFPLERDDYVTERNQVRISGPRIKAILFRFGESRPYAREGGRTTRGTVPAAEKLVARLNDVQVIGEQSPKQRNQIADTLQRWLVEKVRIFFDQQKINVELNFDKPAPQIVADILTAAGTKRGGVAHHLVGAKLALRYPKIEVENRSFTTADLQSGLPGDFLISDTAFHVTVSPMPPVVERCRENLRNGYRAILLVLESRTAAAKQFAEDLGIDSRVGIYAIEDFVGRNIEELGEFSDQNVRAEFRNLLVKYNERIEQVEPDKSIMIEIPRNLG